MKTNNLHSNRLIKLALALGIEEIKNPGKEYHSSQNGMSIDHYHWALELIPDQWKNNEQGVSGLIKNEVLYKVANYFRLTMDEVFHLFVPGYQEEYLGGQLLDEKATPTQLAQNIFCFITIKEDGLYDMEIDEWSMPTKKEKQPKVLTFKPYAERGYNE